MIYSSRESHRYGNIYEEHHSTDLVERKLENI